MCKVWPGLRCSDHPQQRLQKLGEDLHRTEQALSYVEENKKAIFKKDGTVGTKDLTEEQATEHRSKLTEDLKNIQTKIDLEQCGYAMSAGGRNHYKEIAENTENSYAKRIEAATILHAAVARINDQKDMAVVLKDENLTEEDKDLYLHLQETEQEKRIRDLETEKEVVQQKLAKTADALAALAAQRAQQQKPKENQPTEEDLLRQQQELIHQKTTISERLKQRKALKAEIAKHRAEKRKRIQARFDKTADQFSRILTFLLQPQRPLKY